VRAFAEQAGFSPAFISQVENGQVSPSIASLGQLAASLGLTLVDLLLRSSDGPSPVVRAKERPRFDSSWSRAQIELLTSGPGSLQALMVTIEPGGASGKRPSPAPNDYLGVMILGALDLTLGEELITLHEGDAIQIAARLAHRWHNSSTRLAKVLLASVRHVR
jgi:quercetin dioxygenase-like cupin family protein